MVWIALFLSLISMVVAGVLYWRIRRKQEVSVQKFSDQVTGLLAEFNSVTSSKVELLDDRTEELRRVIDRAEMKIDKLKSLIDHAEAAEETLTEEPDVDADSDPSETGQEEVLDLADEGFDVSEIAERTDLTPGEISVILKVNDRTTVER